MKPNKVCRIYVGAAFYYGVMDVYRVDSYSTFSQGTDYWVFTGQKNSIYRNPFAIMRNEFQFGYDFQLGDYVHLQLEVGQIHTKVKGGNNIAPDHIYYSYQGGENHQVGQFSNSNGDLTNFGSGIFNNMYSRLKFSVCF